MQATVASIACRTSFKTNTRGPRLPLCSLWNIPLGRAFRTASRFQRHKPLDGDLDQFLQNFYKVFEHLKPYDFFVFGESYAGMFIPSLARHINCKTKKRWPRNIRAIGSWSPCGALPSETVGSRPRRKDRRSLTTAGGMDSLTSRPATPCIQN